MQVPDWLLVEVALLLIGLTKISLTKSGFDQLSVIESPIRQRARAEKIKRTTKGSHFLDSKFSIQRRLLPMFLAAHSSSLVWWALPNVSHSTHLHSIAFSLYQVHFLYLPQPTFFQPHSKQSGCRDLSR